MGRGLPGGTGLLKYTSALVDDRRPSKSRVAMALEKAMVPASQDDSQKVPLQIIKVFH